MPRTHRIAFLFLALAALAAAAAADNPFYVTFRLGSTSLDADVEDAVDQILDGDDNSLAVGLGFRFGKYMAFQAEWHEAVDRRFAITILRSKTCWASRQFGPTPSFSPAA